MSEAIPAPRAQSAPALPHVLVIVASSVVAIRADQTLEIWEAERFHPVPRAPAYVIGITNWRGTPLPLVDLAVGLGLAQESSGLGGRRVIVVSVEQLLVGLVVDGTAGVMEVDSEACREPTVATSGRLSEFSLGELESPKGIAALVDMGSLLEALRVRP